MSILASARQRVQFIAVITTIFALIVFASSLTVYQWVCQAIKNSVPDANGNVIIGLDCGGDGQFSCHERDSWNYSCILAIIFSIYQIVSSVFLCRNALGTKSWILGNVLIGAYSLYFAWFILGAFPNLMGIYLCNIIVIAVCSTIGFFVQNMGTFEETTMPLLH